MTCADLSTLVPKTTIWRSKNGSANSHTMRRQNLHCGPRPQRRISAVKPSLCRDRSNLSDHQPWLLGTVIPCFSRACIAAGRLQHSGTGVHPQVAKPCQFAGWFTGRYRKTRTPMSILSTLKSEVPPNCQTHNGLLMRLIPPPPELDR